MSLFSWMLAAAGIGVSEPGTPPDSIVAVGPPDPRPRKTSRVVMASRTSRVRPTLEALEDRSVPAVLSVDLGNLTEASGLSVNGTLVEVVGHAPDGVARYGSAVGTGAFGWQTLTGLNGGQVRAEDVRNGIVVGGDLNGVTANPLGWARANGLTPVNLFGNSALAASNNARAFVVDGDGTFLVGDGAVSSFGQFGSGSVTSFAGSGTLTTVPQAMSDNGDFALVFSDGTRIWTSIRRSNGTWVELANPPAAMLGDVSDIRVFPIKFSENGQFLATKVLVWNNQTESEEARTVLYFGANWSQFRVITNPDGSALNSVPVDVENDGRMLVNTATEAFDVAPGASVISPFNNRITANGGTVPSGGFGTAVEQVQVGGTWYVVVNTPSGPKLLKITASVEPPDPPVSNVLKLTGTARADRITIDVRDLLAKGYTGVDVKTLGGDDFIEVLYNSGTAFTINFDTGAGRDQVIVTNRGEVYMTGRLFMKGSLGAGDDYFSAWNTTAVSDVNGDAGNDWLLGGRLNDYLKGGGGIDVFVGGPGNDVMDGGRGLLNVFDARDGGKDTIISSGLWDVILGDFGLDQVYDANGRLKRRFGVIWI